MKTNALVLASFVLLSAVSILRIHAQDAPGEKAESARLSMAVPESPAFLLLDPGSSPILRPSSLQELALAIGNNEGLLKSFAVEFSPYMLIRGKALTIKEYQDNRFLSRTRISFSGKRSDDETGTSTQASIGIRFTIVDDGDPRTNAAYLNTLSKLAMDELLSMEPTLTPPGTESSVLPPSATLEKQIDQAREAFKETQWNSNRLDLAFAALFSGSGTPDEKILLQTLAAWFAGGFQLDKSSQVVFGLNAAISRQSTLVLDKTEASGALRLYMGANQYKFLLEGAMEARDDIEPMFVGSIGGELNFYSSLWLDATLGYEYTADGPEKLRATWNIRWSLPEVASISK